MSEKINISLNLNMFTGLCKLGFFSMNTTNGRSDLQFYKNDIVDLYNGKIVEKSDYTKVYNFTLIPLDKVDLIETIKRSPIFMELAEKL
jgi:hypothetical protein